MKKGISLIVLVITIIVMIILAAGVIITLSNTGVIDRAAQAVKLTDEAAVQDLAALIWADTYLDENKRTDIVNVVKTELAELGVTEDKWNITVDNTGIVVTAKKNETAKNLITFTLEGVECQAEEGMTFLEWMNSSYNTIGGMYYWEYNGDALIRKEGSGMAQTLRKTGYGITYGYAYANDVIAQGENTYWHNLKPSPVPN